MKSYVGAASLTVVLTGCATPTLHELRKTEPNARFSIDAPIACLYDSSAEHVSSYLGMTEPRFTAHMGASGDYAWFRQPRTLIELQTTDGRRTQIQRSQSPSAEGHGDALLEHLQENPCRA